MNILLVNPAWEGLVSKRAHLYNWAFPPLDLLNLAALIKTEGHSVRVLDLRVSPLTKTRLVQEFNSADQIILTTSPLDRWQCPNIDMKNLFNLTALIQDKDKLIMMGVHGTVFPDYILEKSQANLLVRGEPEKTVLEILDERAFQEIKGISFYEKGTIVSNVDQDLIDVDQIPIPDYSTVNIEDYKYPFLGNRLAMLQFSRGCPYKCMFCLKKMYGEGLRRKDPERFIEEIDYVVNKIGAQSVYFYDLTFTAHKPSVYKICELIRERGYRFRWCCQSRAELVDEDLLANMKAAGCRLIHFGVESGSERIAASLDKQTGLEEIRQGIILAKKVGMVTVCFFIGFFFSVIAGIVPANHAARLKPAVVLRQG